MSSFDENIIKTIPDSLVEKRTLIPMFIKAKRNEMERSVSTDIKSISISDILKQVKYDIENNKDSNRDDKLKNALKTNAILEIT